MEDNPRQSYTLGSGSLLMGVRKCVLKGAFIPIADEPYLSENLNEFGWVSKGLPLPSTGGSYVVEFIDKSHVYILAYVDPYGRAFATTKPLSIPPARLPDLALVKDTARTKAEDVSGSIEVLTPDGSTRQVAHFICEANSYGIYHSWYDFGVYGVRLPYEDVMARAYIAFLYRPSLGAPQVPSVGFEEVFACLNNAGFVPSCKALLQLGSRVYNDQALRSPALFECLMRWLMQSGLDPLLAMDLPDNAIRLVRTARYAGTYYLALEETDGVSTEMLWGLESALNRFLLCCERLGSRALSAAYETIARADNELFEAVAQQVVPDKHEACSIEGTPGGEWDTRCAMAAYVESLKLPVRIDVQLRADVKEGVLALAVTTPDPELMPQDSWEPLVGEPGGAWVSVSDDVKQTQAQRYALHVGLMLAAKAFDASALLSQVVVTLRFKGRHDDGLLPRPTLLIPHESAAYCSVTFTRSLYEATHKFQTARHGDPFEPYRLAEAAFDLASVNAFAAVEKLPVSLIRKELPEMIDEPLTGPESKVLGAEEASGLRITFDGALRHLGEAIADALVGTDSVTDAIRHVRQVQEKAAAEGNRRAVEGCTRVMAALTEGKLDSQDQNAIVSSFLGKDRCLSALARAKTFAENDNIAQAVQVLKEAISETATLEGFFDTTEEVYRTFDSYASRIIYNLAVRGDLPDPAQARADAGKKMSMVPDSFYLCHLELTRLLEHSFEHSEEAVNYGRRCVALAPTSGAGYRQLGRSYMLVGDMESAAAVLKECLRIVAQPNDIAMAYYQLAYVLWKQGHYEEGAVCYVKSLDMSPVMAVQSTVELRELLEEASLTLPDQSSIDSEIVRLGLPLAPAPEVLEVLNKACVAAVEANLFAVARNTLALRLRYSPDDALVNVLRSLED